MGKRVFLGPIEICGILAKMSIALSKNGFESDIYCLRPYQFADSDEIYNNPYLSKYERIYKKIDDSKKNGNILAIIMLKVQETIEILKLFFRSIKKYDYFLYIYSMGFFSFSSVLRHIPWLEFFLLKILKKQVIVLCCGSDTRPPYCGVSESTGKQLKKETATIAKKVRMLEKYTIMIDGPASAFFHTKPYISYNCIGNVISSHERSEKEGIVRQNDRVVIFHAPSAKNRKGTDYIQQVIEEIKKERHNIDFVILSGVSHEKILEQISKSDIVVDELYSDFPMAMLDSEASINAVPVITCGYYASLYLDDMPKPIPPTIYVTQDKLKEELVRLVDDRELREEIGKIEQKFIFEHSMDDVVGKKILRIFQDDYPQEWLYYPEKSSYIYGAGCSKEAVEKKVVGLVKKYGMKSLCLRKNSNLYRKYYKLYEEQYQ